MHQSGRVFQSREAVWEVEMKRSILVLGIGNVLMGDEGVGVRVAEALAAEGLPPEVTLVEGGTGGFQLLEYFERFDRMVIVDASLDGHPPGTLNLLTPKYAADFPPTLTAHDIGLKDLVDAAELLGHKPEVGLITISIADLQHLGMELSPPVLAAVPMAVARVREVVADWLRQRDFTPVINQKGHGTARRRRHA